MSLKQALQQQQQKKNAELTVFKSFRKISESDY